MSAEAALLAKLRRGEAITPLDHIPTIDGLEELEAFRKALIDNKRMTPDIQTAIYRHQNRLGTATRGNVPASRR